MFSDKINQCAEICCARFESLRKDAGELWSLENCKELQRLYTKQLYHFRWMMRFEIGIFMQDLMPCILQMKDILGRLSRELQSSKLN